jgi:hypothetical protein
MFFARSCAARGSVEMMSSNESLWEGCEEAKSRPCGDWSYLEELCGGDRLRGGDCARRCFGGGTPLEVCTEGFSKSFAFRSANTSSFVLFC